MQPEPMSLDTLIALGFLAIASFALMCWAGISIAQRVGWLPPIEKRFVDDDDYVAGRRGQKSRDLATDRPVASTTTEPVNRIAMPGNVVNAELPGNAGNETVDAVVVEAEVIARLIRSGRLHVEDPKRPGVYKPIGQTELIEIAGGVTRSGRPDSPYAQLRAALVEILEPPPRQIPTHGQVEGSVELPARR